MLFFHGNGGNLSGWLPVIAAIHAQGYAVTAFDYRGYGLGTGAPSERGLYQDVDAVLAWWTPRQRPGVPVVFWGRSLGTTFAAYAATKVRPAGLVLESGFPEGRVGDPRLARAPAYSRALPRTGCRPPAIGAAPPAARSW